MKNNETKESPNHAKDWLATYLPAGWEQAAKETKALQRSRRIQTAEDLLALNLLYLTEAGSHQETAIMLEMTRGIHLSKTDVCNRLRRSWPWLRWMGEALCREHGLVMPEPTWLQGRTVKLLDASNMEEKGARSNDWRLHYTFDLFGFRCDHAEITTVREGETLLRHTINPGDIIIADRMYGNIRGMEHVLASGGDFVLRLKTNAFHLYNAQGEKLDLRAQLRPLAPLEYLSLDAFYKVDGTLRPVRIVAMRKDEEAHARAAKKQTQKASRLQRKPSRPSQEMSAYVVLATSLTETPERIGELYRARWQIEQVFHRLKSIFRFGELPGTHPDSVNAWFYGKLFVAALCEVAVMRGNFSPYRYTPEGT